MKLDYFNKNHFVFPKTKVERNEPNMHLPTLLPKIDSAASIVIFLI